MTALASAFLALAVTVWDCPGLQVRHDALRGEFIAAMAKGDADAMEDASRRGIELMPDDPTWRYNHACSLARRGERSAALDELDRAVSMGYRRPDEIAADADLKTLSADPRFKDLVERARRPGFGLDIAGPLESVPAMGTSGQPVALGAQNMKWNFDRGYFEADVSLDGTDAPFSRMLYHNLDDNHSTLVVTNYPGLSRVMVNKEGAEKGVGQNYPQIRFPYPVFGNCSRSYTRGPLWRSLPRALMTVESRRLRAMHEFYMSNQVWAYPAASDYKFETNSFGDVYASVTPYWILTEGHSWTDRPYLDAALDAVKAMTSATKDDIVRRGLLAPTLQMLLRKSLKGVRDESDYLTAKAHPTAFPPNGIDRPRLRKLAAALRPDTVPPVANIVGIGSQPVLEPSEVPEMLYATPCAAALVLRSPDTLRSFAIRASGGAEYAFAAVHGLEGAARVEQVRPDSAIVKLDRLKMTPTNRVDVAVFARNPGTQWGAPAFVSFAVVDPSAPYADPLLIPKEPPKGE